jgi:hypothetical protein
MAIDVHQVEAPTTHVLAREFEDLTDWFDVNGLAPPPVPVALRDDLRQQQPWVWSTIPLDPWRLVDNDRALAAMGTFAAVDHLVVGVAGRHSERRRIVYQLAHQGLAIVASCLWRPDHGEHDAEVLDQTFFAIGALLQNLGPDVERLSTNRPSLLIEVHGRSVRWWRPDHERGPFGEGPDADGCWETLARQVCVGRPSWRVRVLDRLPGA